MIVFHTEIQRLVPLWAIRAFVTGGGQLLTGIEPR